MPNLKEVRNNIDCLNDCFFMIVPKPEFRIEIFKIPLKFVFVEEKGVADKLLRDSYDHTIDVGARYFKGNYLKLTRSKHPNCKQFQVIQQQVIFPAEEIYDTYVDINEQLQINTMDW